MEVILLKYIIMLVGCFGANKEISGSEIKVNKQEIKNADYWGSDRQHSLF